MTLFLAPSKLHCTAIAQEEVYGIVDVASQWQRTRRRAEDDAVMINAS